MDSMFRFRRESLLKTRLRFFHSKIDLLIYIIAEDSEFSNGPIWGKILSIISEPTVFSPY